MDNEQILRDIIESLLVQLDAKNRQIEWLQNLVDNININKKEGVNINE